MTEQEQAQVNATNALLENQRLMGAIIAEMKEIPELPSEVPKDTHALLRVELPDTGGVLTYMEGYEYPYKGFPFHEFVDKIDGLKKISRGMLSSLFHSFKKRSKLQLATLVLVPWLFNDLLRGGLYAFHRIIIRFKIKELRYSDAVREVYRAMSAPIDGEKVSEKELREIVRDLLCMVLENDNAYRFRFQDIISELNMVYLRKNTAKELVRLLRIMQKRENNQDVSDTWTLLITFLPMYLFMNPCLKKRIVQIAESLNRDNTKLSEEDKFFCAMRSDYKFGFKQNVSN